MEKTRRAAPKPTAGREKRARVVVPDSSVSALPVGAPAKRHHAIVSSSHLAVSEMPALSEFEFGLTVANNSFSRWVARCMAAAGLPGLAPMDVLVLHHVHHRARDKRLADIAFTLNVEDLHVVNYSLKKLLAAGVVETTKHGKEVLYRTNGEGKRFIERYREVRERCLVSALSRMQDDGDTIHETARILRWLSGLYDQAARAATSL